MALKPRRNRSGGATGAQQLLEDKGLRKKMASHARRFAKDYSLEQFTKNVREIYAITPTRASGTRLIFCRPGRVS